MKEKVKVKGEGEERTVKPTVTLDDVHEDVATWENQKVEKSTAKPKVKGEGEEINETFNNPRLVLMNLCYATMAVWSVYDEVSTMASKNRLILTGKERETIRNVDSALLDCYMNLSGLMDTRLKEVVPNRDKLKRHDAAVKANATRNAKKEGGAK